MLWRFNLQLVPMTASDLFPLDHGISCICIQKCKTGLLLLGSLGTLILLVLLLQKLCCSIEIIWGDTSLRSSSHRSQNILLVIRLIVLSIVLIEIYHHIWRTSLLWLPRSHSETLVLNLIERDGLQTCNVACWRLALIFWWLLLLESVSSCQLLCMMVLYVARHNICCSDFRRTVVSTLFLAEGLLHQC